jgi:hypothetical protein
MKYIRLISYGFFFVFNLYIKNVLADSEVHNTSDGAVSSGVVSNRVEVLWNSDGTVKMIQSRYSVSAKSFDRKAIRQALLIAEEKAKANLVRFLEQDITTTSTFVTIVHSEVGSSNSKEGASDSKNSGDQNDILLSEKFTEITRSYAKGSLSGIIVLDQGFDEEFGEVWIIVALSNRAISTVNSIQ